MKDDIPFMLVMIGIPVVLFFAFGLDSDASENHDEYEYGYEWEFVPLINQPVAVRNSAGYDPEATVLGVLYNKRVGPAEGVYGLVVEANCTALEDAEFGSHCRAYQWSSKVLTFPLIDS